MTRNARVSRKGGSIRTNRHVDEVLVPNRDDQPVLGRASSGLGIVVPEAISGLKNIEASDLAGPFVGGFGYFLGTYLAGKYGHKISMKLVEYKDIIGVLGGALISLPLYYWKRDPKVMIQGILSAAVVGAAVFAMKKTGTLAGTGYRRPFGLGLLTAQRAVGALPGPSETTRVPGAVQYQADTGAYGQSV